MLTTLERLVISDYFIDLEHLLIETDIILLSRNHRRPRLGGIKTLVEIKGAMVKPRYIPLLILYKTHIATSYNVLSKLLSNTNDWPDIMTALSASSAISSSVTNNVHFHPVAGVSWNIELSVVPKVAEAKDHSYHVWDMDVFDSPKSTISAFQAEGHPVICYFSAGSWENWRPDADEFPKKALGKPLDGWPGEKWLDTRDPAVRKIMKQRIELAKSKGCDGVDPDNIDGYENPTGFHLTKDDGVDYVKFLAETAHGAGLAFGLKNGGGILERVVDVSEWSVNEQCVKYNECDLYRPFIKQNKPVFHIEYTAKHPAPEKFVKKVCNWKDARGFSTLIKHLSLDAWTTTCP